MCEAGNSRTETILVRPRKRAWDYCRSGSRNHVKLTTGLALVGHLPMAATARICRLSGGSTLNLWGRRTFQARRGAGQGATPPRSQREPRVSHLFNNHRFTVLRRIHLTSNLQLEKSAEMVLTDRDILPDAYDPYSCI
jgi:hypothetical protein